MGTGINTHFLHLSLSPLSVLHFLSTWTFPSDSLQFCIAKLFRISLTFIPVPAVRFTSPFNLDFPFGQLAILHSKIVPHFLHLSLSLLSVLHLLSTWTFPPDSLQFCIAKLFHFSYTFICQNHRKK